MANRAIDMILVQASSTSWRGGTDPCMLTIDGVPLLTRTLMRARAMAPDVPICIAAPEFDKGNLDQIASLISNCIARYSFTEKPLLRLIEAADKLDGNAVVLRIDGQHSFFREEVIWSLVEKLHAENLDLARSPDDFPPGLTGDVWRVEGLRKVNEVLQGFSPSEAARHYVHPKFIAMKPIAGMRTASVKHPAVSDDALREIRNRQADAFKEDHIEVTKKSIASGDQISFHYRIASEYLRPGDVVLDIASGKGFGGDIMANRGCQVVCADIDQSKLDEGRELFQRKEITFSRQNVFDMTFPNDMFDVVTSMETMEHVADVDRYLTQLKRVLRPNGLLILSTPQNALGHIPLTPAHEKEYSLQEFRLLCGRHFQIEKIIGLKAGTIYFDDDPVGGNSMAILRKNADAQTSE